LENDCQFEITGLSLSCESINKAVSTNIIQHKLQHNESNVNKGTWLNVQRNKKNKSKQFNFNKNKTGTVNGLQDFESHNKFNILNDRKKVSAVERKRTLQNEKKCYRREKNTTRMRFIKQIRKWQLKHGITVIKHFKKTTRVK
jgi:hypothetical protein